jgi:hypothetical protein
MRKTGRIHMRCSPLARARWEERATELGLSVSAYLEVLAHMDFEKSKRDKALARMYPQKYR